MFSRRWSVRSRLMLAIGVLVSAALVGAGLALYIVQTRSLDSEIDHSLTHDIDAFRTFEAKQSYDSPGQLLDAFMTTAVTSDNEIYWGFTENAPSYTGRKAAAERMLTSDTLEETVGALAASGGKTTVKIDGHDVRVVVLPLEQADDRAAFVITHDVTASRSQLRAMMKSYAIISLLAIVLVTALAGIAVSAMLKPVEQLRRKAQDINAGSLGSRLDITGTDDFADVQVAFNAMLDRLETAFDAQKQMLDDAGHELRTPLTVLRGHLEVLDPSDPADVTGTRDLLIDETERMSRLVSDLIVLAKSGRPDFIKAVDTDVAELTRGIIERSRGLATRNWRVGATATGIVQLDRDRITQALLQLADNAIRFTDVDGTIEISSYLAADTLSFRVRDDGVGVDPVIRGDIFQRFTASQDGHEGFGLGLSIVQAIVEAHHGTIILEHTEHGASFLINLPLERVG